MESHGRAPRISVIVPAYNAAPFIAECLRGLACQTVPAVRYEVIVVDDGSTDRTGAIAEGLGARVVRIARAGPAVARNQGIKMAGGTYLLFTDADCVPTPTWIEELVAPLEAGADGAKGVYLTRQTGLLPRFIQAEFEERYRLLARSEQIDFVDTYAAGYRREALDRHGAFDPRFTVPSAEDAELSFRLASRGCRLVFAPRARVYHQHPTTIVGYLRRKFLYGVFRIQAYRSSPEKIARDSYTPRLMIAEILVAAVLLGALVLGTRSQIARRVTPLLLAAHLGLSLPFTLAAAGRDPGLILVAPWLILGRSCAQAIGCMVGVARLLDSETRLRR